MCLSKIFDEIKTQEILKKLPEIITVYKIVGKDGTYKAYRPYFFWEKGSYKEGENEAVFDPLNYPDGGFYSFKSFWKTLLIRFTDYECLGVIIKCKINKKDIIKIGINNKATTFVTSKITIPKYKE